MLEKELNEIATIYGKKYALNNEDLRETQIFVVNPEF